MLNFHNSDQFMIFFSLFLPLLPLTSLAIVRNQLGRSAKLLPKLSTIGYQPIITQIHQRLISGQFVSQWKEGEQEGLEGEVLALTPSCLFIPPNYPMPLLVGTVTSSSMSSMNLSLDSEEDMLMGIGFGLAAIFAATMISTFRISLADVAQLCFSSLVSITVHEFGHAIAAASEGIQIEYISLFIAILFPGALVALNYEVLGALSCQSALRIYCAGIWHNLVCSAICRMAMFFLPLILYPLYIHGESPMVIDVPTTSPLYGYLSSGDTILSLDGSLLHNPREWFEMAAMIDNRTLKNLDGSGNFRGSITGSYQKGYCVPGLFIENIQLADNESRCPVDLTAFSPISCPNSTLSNSWESLVERRVDLSYCLDANKIIPLKKCGDGWMNTTSIGSSCACSKDESCLGPVKLLGLNWVEITYSTPYSSGCSRSGKNPIPGSESSEIGEIGCGGTFVFVGDLISMAHSVQLSAYRPRWSFSFGANFPIILKRILAFTFHVSLALALLNGLPSMTKPPLLFNLDVSCLNQFTMPAATLTTFCQANMEKRPSKVNKIVKSRFVSNESFSWTIVVGRDQLWASILFDVAEEGYNTSYLVRLLVYFLDGQSILEKALCFITLLSTRKREMVLKVCLIGGTLFSVIAFLRITIAILFWQIERTVLFLLVCKLSFNIKPYIFHSLLTAYHQRLLFPVNKLQLGAQGQELGT
ncbi:Peptidase M50 [Dillenia turbinata]|uniref:Endopeptidase S2P n=1 Tax=Dillenia turbinata TaxID=194707 RepID=A0AAN8VF50_9MAGN